MAKKYISVNESTAKVVLSSEETARSDGYRNLTAEERLLWDIKENTGRIRTLLDIIALLIILGVIVGGCGVLFAVV